MRYLIFYLAIKDDLALYRKFAYFHFLEAQLFFISDEHYFVNVPPSNESSYYFHKWFVHIFVPFWKANWAFFARISDNIKFF